MIHTVALFPVLDKLLIECLRSCAEEDWKRFTLARKWTVKDVAAHLLDGNIRTISMLRDGHFGEPPAGINSYSDLVNYLNNLNADWVAAYKRVSTALLIEQLEKTGPEYWACMASLDPMAEAIFTVSWAGETRSLNWFHVAREYTEKWHHQQQIRTALGMPEPLMVPELFDPFISTLLMGMPHALRNSKAGEGSLLKMEIISASLLRWNWKKTVEGWKLIEEYEAGDDRNTIAGVSEKETNDAGRIATASIRIPAELAWQLFTRAINPLEAMERVEIDGSKELAREALGMVAVMA
ncbi:maleylpyruvate isomerase N-terminal domain-containing protein [Flavihumibacter sp. ZG627]|uniref:maleylpyruvate isomerase N-terminal domain-containing protein n=1 Tax=Flavihumibacter sp. ZG627 TaxID=1463156 RepID=UPI00057D2380|nr:maleylpyruvate isomerase N-terminal domain-containing protein [Flavihumibacter sp. ZG627]KIC89424.1 hypothetical protein HY58_16270 [Flavihumibacter sp. ZG627]